jgi:hypothetical protein
MHSAMLCRAGVTQALSRSAFVPACSIPSPHARTAPASGSARSAPQQQQPLDSGLHPCIAKHTCSSSDTTYRIMGHGPWNSSVT